ncbi:3-deoxy-7-phosphoheptulonate synthase [Ktedonobacteria bacterium brp13]|nr:3-deoxy-7-phosphoheptulonate synthase [Ktedonobacteria bacterium brp13]
MIVVMNASCSDIQIEQVFAFLHKHQLEGHLSRGIERTVIGVLGNTNGQRGTAGNIGEEIEGALQGLAGVEDVLRVSKPYKLASREFHPEDTVVEVPSACTDSGVVRIGAKEVVMMAGPCTVESEAQLMKTAQAVYEAGAVILRGGAFKPSTSPYGFRGMGEKGLKLLAKARAEFGMAIVTEVLTPADVALVSEYADILQIGTRNMQNYMLLDEVGRSARPIMLKRGMSATLEEWLLAAEYILTQGNPDVILCERGIRTFEKATRNTMDISAIPLVKKLSHLPIVADPSQGTGRRDIVDAMSLAAIASGADGLLIEVHPHPEEALKDGAQSLRIEQFQTLMPQASMVAQACNRQFVRPTHQAQPII